MDTYKEFSPAIRKALVSHNTTQGYGTSDADLLEALTESDVIYREITENHRWYDVEFRVVKIGDKFIGFDDFHITGDDSASDMGLSYNLSEVYFCEPSIVTTTVYRPIK